MIKPNKFFVICSSKKLILFCYILSLTVLDLHFKNMTNYLAVAVILSITFWCPTQRADCVIEEMWLFYSSSFSLMG